MQISSSTAAFLGSRACTEPGAAAAVLTLVQVKWGRVLLWICSTLSGHKDDGVGCHQSPPGKAWDADGLGASSLCVGLLSTSAPLALALLWLLFAGKDLFP